MPDGFTMNDEPTASDAFPPPDLRVLRLHRREPAPMPLEVFGPEWSQWLLHAAEAAAAPVDYAVAPLLSAASALIGNARWAEAYPGWAEPPHLWCVSVGDSGGGKSPGADAMLRDVLPILEGRMTGDFPDRHREWEAAAAAATARREAWEKEVRSAIKMGNSPPQPPEGSEAPPEPQMPRLRFNDATIEKVALLLANSAPKGVLMVRDEVAGWLLSMNAYNEGGRAFWLEAYGGRPYRVERVKHPVPVDVPHLAVAWFGGIQPARLAEVMQGADDGLLARFCWFWPYPKPYDLPQQAPSIGWAVAALDRLRLLELGQGTAFDLRPAPIRVSLAPEAKLYLVRFVRDMQARQDGAGGLMSSALGKARGLTLRLSLILEYLWWVAAQGMTPPPAQISVKAFLAAATLVADYLMPMAERVFGDATARDVDRNAATIARWIVKTRPTEVHVRRLQREVRLPGLADADAIHAAAQELVQSGWLMPPPRGEGFQQRGRAAYRVRTDLWEALERQGQPA